ncbi:hypothetical protein AFAEC_1135 [Aliarcobacter faecis]|uniref:hypothetical protein n=1 Tax=Aliarcobacter faecis TaxID=1564138 RepID=UPI000478E13A|nr:hypothetical protein [Aliarcobacter faecis]QKF73301.1 hypothetical protein AFAEC_1135 [Aliarcobacter faecis]
MKKILLILLFLSSLLFSSENIVYNKDYIPRSYPKGLNDLERFKTKYFFDAVKSLVYYHTMNIQKEKRIDLIVSFNDVYDIKFILKNNLSKFDEDILIKVLEDLKKDKNIGDTFFTYKDLIMTIFI